MKQECIDVVYQYLDGPSVWDELRYSLRSVSKNLQGEIRLWFVGDMPSWVTGASHIPIKKETSDNFPVCLDATRKMNAVILHPEIGEKFIYMYDDMYFIKPTNPDNLSNFFHLRGDMKARKVHTKHAKLVYRTADVFFAKGQQPRCAETHLPKLYRKSEMLEVFKTYQPIRNRYLHGTLYYNHFADRYPKVELSKTDRIKAEFYGNPDYLSEPSDDINHVREVLARKQFLNHTNAGLTPALKQALEEMFPEPCVWEGDRKPVIKESVKSKKWWEKLI